MVQISLAPATRFAQFIVRWAAFYIATDTRPQPVCTHAQHHFLSAALGGQFAFRFNSILVRNTVRNRTDVTSLVNKTATRNEKTQIGLKTLSTREKKSEICSNPQKRGFGLTHLNRQIDKKVARRYNWDVGLELRNVADRRTINRFGYCVQWG